MVTEGLLALMGEQAPFVDEMWSLRSRWLRELYSRNVQDPARSVEEPEELDADSDDDTFPGEE